MIIPSGATLLKSIRKEKHKFIVEDNKPMMRDET